MKLTGVHFLLTYQCNFECDHCFVWGSPWQCGVMTLRDIRTILKQAQGVPSVKSIYFEGGEPFLYYATMLRGIKEAVQAGFQVGIVTNTYWATDFDDALEWLQPLAGLVDDLSLSSDLYHWDEKVSQQVKNARRAAEQLKIPVGTISIAEPELSDARASMGKLPEGESGVMFRGRAYEKLVARATKHAWDSFTECPHEDLVEVGRIHLDPLGYVHVCQGISAGNVFQTPLAEICAQYQPESHPIIGPLLEGGPAELVREYGLEHAEVYADACHLCFEARLKLRPRFPEILTPDQMYGVVEG
ncbi:MAG: radical SAM protein [Chloroflexota bacterium]